MSPFSHLAPSPKYHELNAGLSKPDAVSNGAPDGGRSPTPAVALEPPTRPPWISRVHARWARVLAAAPPRATRCGTSKGRTGGGATIRPEGGAPGGGVPEGNGEDAVCPAATAGQTTRQTNAADAASRTRLGNGTTEYVLFILEVAAWRAQSISLCRQDPRGVGVTAGAVSWRVVPS